MPHSPKTVLGVAAVALALIAAPRPAAGQAKSTTNLSTYSLTLLGGVGGSADESESGFDNSALQVGFSVVTERSVKVGARLGSLGSIERMGGLLDTDLTYLTISGEYAFGEAGYQSGVFFGLGLYRVEGLRRFTGADESTTTAGLTGGINAYFDVARRVDIVAELAVHGLTQGESQFFVTALAGVGINLW